MKIEKYLIETQRTLPNLGTSEANNLHMALGISTEAGELLDIFKKRFAYKKTLDWVNVKEELGDLMWYISNFCAINGFDFEEILELNINKLKTRFPEKFTEHKANNRDLKEERRVLEGKQIPLIEE